MPTDSDSGKRGFVDTNVFAYSLDRRDPAKRAKALALIERLTDSELLVISTQVVNELCAIMLRGKLGSAVSESDLIAIVEELEAAAEVVVLTLDTTRLAARARFMHGMSWYDGLIWASAKLAGCDTVYTEDKPGAPEIEGVRYINPFL